MDYIYLLAGVLLIAGVGGLAGIVPRRKDRWLAKVRTLARKRNLVVDSRHLPVLSLKPEDRISAGGRLREAKRLCVRYRKLISVQHRDCPTWTLLSDPESSVPIQGWRVEAGEIRGTNLFQREYWSEVKNILDQAPKRCWAAQVSSEFSAWIGLEAFDERSPDQFVEEIEIFLDRLAARQRVCSSPLGLTLLAGEAPLDGGQQS